MSFLIHMLQQHPGLGKEECFVILAAFQLIALFNRIKFVEPDIDIICPEYTIRIHTILVPSGSIPEDRNLGAVR